MADEGAISRQVSAVQAVGYDAAYQCVVRYLVDERHGKIVRQTPSKISVRLGSRTYFRIMGISGGRKRLPILVSAEISEAEDGSLVTLKMRSDEGWYLLAAHSVVRRYFEKAFQNITEHTMNHLNKSFASMIASSGTIFTVTGYFNI